MAARQNKKRKGRNHVNNRERTVTTFTEDPNTSFLVPLSSEDPPTVLAAPFPMPYQNYIPPPQQQFFQPILPPGKNDLEILENLKTIIKEGQHEFYRAVPQPAALASLYVGHIPPQAHPDQLPQEYPPPRFSQGPALADGGNAPELFNNVPFRCLTPVLALTLVSDRRGPHSSSWCRHVTHQIRRRPPQHRRRQPALSQTRPRRSRSSHNTRPSSRHQDGRPR